MTRDEPISHYARHIAESSIIAADRVLPVRRALPHQRDIRMGKRRRPARGLECGAAIISIAVALAASVVVATYGFTRPTSNASRDHAPAVASPHPIPRPSLTSNAPAS